MKHSAALPALLLTLALGASPAPAADAPLFTDVTDASGIPGLRFGEGVNAVDIDGDDLPELFLPCVRGRDRLWRNRGGLRFEDVTEAWGVSGSGGIGASVGDLDRDGRPEIAVVRGAWPTGSVSLLSRQPDGRFRDVGAEAGVVTSRNGIAAAINDVDGDGRPDLFVSGWGGDLLFRNRSGERLAFAESARTAGLGEGGRSWGAVFTDLTGDGLRDLVVARGGKGSAESTRLFVNAGGGRFEDRTAATDLGLGGWSMGATALDCDADGDLDLFVTQYEGADRLYRNEGGGRLRDATAHSGIASRAGVGASAGFVDGDALPDLVVASFAGPVHLYRNLGDCRFADATSGSGLQSHPRNEGAVLADLDADGDLDLYVTNYDGANRLYRNNLDDGAAIRLFPAPGRTGLHGATVRLPGAKPGGPQPVLELDAGHGYCSQGPASFLIRVGTASADLSLAFPGAAPLSLRGLAPGASLRLPE